MSYKRLGDYIIEKVEFNEGGKYKLLQGVSNNKYFQKAKTNIIGIDLSKYRVAHYNQFVFNRATTRNGDKISIALRKGESCIVSPSYRIFQVRDENVLHPDYLQMWFSRPEFDRYARFKSHGSAHEFFDMEEMREVELPIPSMDEQRQIVAQYQSIANKIKVNEQICEKLEAAAQALYKHWFVDFEFPVGHCEKRGTSEEANPALVAEERNIYFAAQKGYKSSGGKMVWNEELGKEIPEGWERDFLKNYCKIKGGKRLPKDHELNSNNEGRPYIRVADMNKGKFITLNSKFQYVSDEIQKSISRYIVEKRDVLISIVGTIGLVNIIDESLHQANLTENCFKITNCQIINSDYLYHFLTSNEGQREIEMKTVGGVQAKLPMYNVELLEIMIPSESILKDFKTVCNNLNDHLINKKIELDKLTQLQGLLLSRLAVGEEVGV